MLLLIKFKLGNILYRYLKFAIEKLSIVKMRRLSIKLYGFEHENPFEYAGSLALGSSVLLMIIMFIFLLVSGTGILTSIVYLILAFVMGIFLEYKDMQKKYIMKQREMGIQFSTFASHCAIFISSGVSVRNAFIKSVDFLEQGELLEILQLQLCRINVGDSLNDICSDVSRYMPKGSFNAFLSILVQMQKYGNYNEMDIRKQIDEVWNQRRYTALMAGKELETKLIFPSMLIFMGVMGMVMSAMILKMMIM